MGSVSPLINGERLRDLRLGRLLTQRELSSRSGIAPETINRIENATAPRKVTALTLRKLASALEVSPEELEDPGEE